MGRGKGQRAEWVIRGEGRESRTGGKEEGQIGRAKGKTGRVRLQKPSGQCF